MWWVRSKRLEAKLRDKQSRLAGGEPTTRTERAAATPPPDELSSFVNEL